MKDGTEVVGAGPHDELMETVRRAIQASGYAGPLSRIEVSMHEGQVVLSGQVGSFYHKQVAQAVVMQTVADIPLRNDVQVRSPR